MHFLLKKRALHEAKILHQDKKILDQEDLTDLAEKELIRMKKDGHSDQETSAYERDFQIK